jgi:ATP-dependent RNA helicase DHX8/PRP22
MTYDRMFPYPGILIMDDDFAKLEHLGLVNRVCRELQNHLGVSDKDLAEYLLDLAGKYQEGLKAQLEKEGVAIPDALVDSILRISKEKSGDRSESSNDKNTPNIKDLNQNGELRALSMPNDPEKARSLLGQTASNRNNFDGSRREDYKVSNRYSGQSEQRSTRATEPRTSRSNIPAPSRKRLTSPERFELKQLIAAGVLNAADYPDLYTAYESERKNRNSELDLTGVDEAVEIELNESEPVFLKGSQRIVADLSPVRIVKNPQGSLARAAMSGSAMVTERREAKQAAARAEKDPKEALSQSWNDPLARDRVFAEELKALERQAEQAPRVDLRALCRPKAEDSASKKSYSEMTIKEQRESLPIYKLRAELMTAIRDNPILVVIGDTGSGKTTQITQYLAEDGYTDKGGKIGCTQPRRVAAMSVAERVAQEVGCKVGQEVGYTIRFEDKTSRDTLIKYMTDGMLLRECLVDPFLRSYSVIILDEAHERTVNTDVLFGLLKGTCAARPDFRLIVTSATLDAEKFCHYFSDCPVFTIPGRSFPVQVLYSQEPEPEYLEAALRTVLRIHVSEPLGDILVFLTGQEEIETACEVLNERSARLAKTCPHSLLVLPVYSALPGDLQSRIFQPAPPNSRKVVLATNIAETSITIDGIFYVIDPGFCKQKAFNAKLGMDTLQVTPISQAQARQRAGRAGRTGPGKCFRLYTQAAHDNEMLSSAIPEIQRTNLTMTVLTLKAMGINDLIGFDFLDPPPLPSLLAAMDGLYQLGALDDEGLLTRIGRKMAEYPLEPQISRMLLRAAELRCASPVLTIAAMLSLQGSVFFRPRDRQDQADHRKASFHHPEGDHLTLLNVFDSWVENGRSAGWCQEHFIQHRSMKRAADIREQLRSIMERFGERTDTVTDDTSLIRRAICSGFFMNAARRDPQEGYRTLHDDQPVYIHPSSALFQRGPQWLLYHELVMTSREWMRDVMAVDPRWLVEAAPNMYKVADRGGLTKRQKTERIVPLHNPRDKNEDWRLSRQATQYRQARSR